MTSKAASSYVTAVAQSGPRKTAAHRARHAGAVEAAAHRALAYADMAMLIGPGGRGRTEADFQALLDDAGFKLTRIIAIAPDYSILEAVPR